MAAGLCAGMSSLSLGGAVSLRSGAARVAGTQLPTPATLRLPSAGPARCPVRMAQSLQGKVVSTAGMDTIVVAVERFVPHPIYKKRCRVTKRYKVHAPTGEADIGLGDIIEITPCRPISKTKRFTAGTVVLKRQ